MSEDKDKKEKSPVTVKVSPNGTCVKSRRKSSTSRLIFTKDSAIDFEDVEISERCRRTPEGRNKKETTITTNFATPPRPKK